MPCKTPPFLLSIFAACARYSGAPLLPSAAYIVENEGLKTHILQNEFVHRRREFATAPLARTLFKNNHQKMIPGVPWETSLSTPFRDGARNVIFLDPRGPPRRRPGVSLERPGCPLGVHWETLGIPGATLGQPSGLLGLPR